MNVGANAGVNAAYLLAACLIVAFFVLHYAPLNTSEQGLLLFFFIPTMFLSSSRLWLKWLKAHSE
jgi:hypothetical protein